MSKSNFKFQDFLTTARNQHIPRSDRFEVVFELPEALIMTTDLSCINYNQVLSLMCEEAQLPGIVGTNMPFKVGPWTEYRTQNIEYMTTDMTFTFIVDEKWKGREIFEDWIAIQSNPITKEVSFYNDVVSTVKIRSLSLNDDIMAEWILIDAAPKIINITPVSWGNTQHIRMNVSMSAKRWERNYDLEGLTSTKDYKSKGVQSNPEETAVMSKGVRTNTATVNVSESIIMEEIASKGIQAAPAPKEDSVLERRLKNIIKDKIGSKIGRITLGRFD